MASRVADLGARHRSWLGRHPTAVQIAVAVVTVATFLDVRSELEGARSAARGWSETRPVWVTTEPLAPGDAIDAVAVAREVPEAVIPDGAIDAGESLAGIVAGRAVAPGSVLTDLDRRGGGSAPPSMVPDGWLIVPVHSAAADLLAPGARVRVVAAGAVLSASGLVVEPGGDDRPTLLAVPADAAPGVASGLDGLALVIEP